jgi:putative transposase
MAKAEKTMLLAKHFKVHRSRVYRQRKMKLRPQEERDFRLIKQIFEERREKVGSRQVKMLLERRFGVVMNRKKIQRIMNERGLFTRIRRRSYRAFYKKLQEHRTAKNLLARNFDQARPDAVYSTDITELPYGSGKKAYLAAFKDLRTKEIVASTISKRIDLKLVEQALKKAIYRLPKSKREKLMIHSDQGFHFTHRNFRKILATNKIAQSMSRKGNCIDNAPMESFFGHLKDHLEPQKTFESLSISVTKEIEYYNSIRPQWDLKRMPPKSFRRHCQRTAGFS